MNNAFLQRVFAVWALGVLLSTSSVAAPNDATNVFKRAAPSVVVVEALGTDGKTRQGSGVIFDSDAGLFQASWIVSNAHVVQGATKVKVSQAGKRYVANVEYYDGDTDLAVLRIYGAALSAALVRGAADVDVGTTVFAIGSPLGLENSITEGIVSAKRTSNDISVIQTSASISPGSSGGGLFDSDGRLIGVTTFKLKGGENLNFAVDASYVHLLKEAVWVAGAIRGSVAESVADTLRARIDSNIFVHWLLRAHDVDGRPLYLRARRVLFDGLKEGKNSNPRESMEALNSHLREFAQRFFAEGQSGSDVPSSTPVESGGIVVLDCFQESSTRRYDVTVTIDYRQQTANGYAAEISDTLVRWRHGPEDQFSMLNRYTGTLLMQSPRFGVLASGKCVPTGPRRF